MGGPSADGPALRPVTPIGIVAAELDALVDEIAAAPGVADDVRARLVRARDLAAGLDPYLGRCTSPESAALARLARATATARWGDGPLEAEMLSGHVEGRFLAMLVGLTGARRVLEIGLFTGYSALAMAEALPADGELVACELDPAAAAFAADAMSGAPGGDRVRIVVGPAAQTLDELGAAGERFDLVFVDADKAGYEGYLDQLLDLGLVGPGALICVDNTLLQGEAYLGDGSATVNGRAIAAFNRRVADDARVEQVLLPLRDGVTLIRLLAHR